jgi:hypothetical protein
MLGHTPKHKQKKIAQSHFKNKQRIPKKVLNLKLKGNVHEKDPQQDWDRLGKMSHRSKEELGKR